ncbi:YaaC family protein [Bacillus sp. T33-2]|uniref:YaaC family protein n=1 Tax=Bacillus sp. T33-2 TaxID=2054168 RepID=UPI000C76C187|nr:YaaC family protein [Bacillus sp. T33-2]PLR89837.1 hypothetical protein CVD19_23190 [Bacillus sp. T33-2]
MLYKYNGWSSYCAFFSADYSQAFLKKCYQQINLSHPEQKSFENCYPFIYYLEHGKIYYEQAASSPIHIQPILMFYGLIHIIKACILTVEPEYPETTSVLAHGVSARKRKKQQYHFFEDEVKIQKNGLFSLMAEKMFHMKQLEGEKVSMGELLQHIPELKELFKQMKGKETFAAVTYSNGCFTMNTDVLDAFHMTKARFEEFYRSKSPIHASFLPSEDGYIKFQLEQSGPERIVPLKFHLYEKQYLFPLTKDVLFDFPELLLHYLLLYNLSMIARYETEWWSELIKMMPNEDYPFIQSFLNITLSKGPYLIYEYLMNK